MSQTLSPVLAGPSTAGPRRHARRQLPGFTLVELLVVIGIIAALIAILLPTLSAARRQAQLAKCLSGTRQIATAFFLHAQERGGAFPLAGDIQVRSTATTTDPDRVPKALGDPTRRKYTYAWQPPIDGNKFVPMPWQASLSSYVSNNYRPPTQNWDLVEDSLNNTESVWKHYMCPSSDLATRGTQTVGGIRYPLEQGTVALVTINGSWNYVWSSNADYVVNEGLLGWDYRPNFRRLKGNAAKLKRGQEICLLTDGQRRQYLRDESPLTRPPGSYAPYPTPVPPTSFTDSWQVWAPRDTATQTHINRDVYLGEAIPLVTSPRVSPTDIQATAVADYRQFDRVRHRGRINIAFLDGHCETRMISRAGLMDVLILPRP